MTETDFPALPGGLITPDQWVLPETSVRRSIRGAVRQVLEQLQAGMSADESPFQSLDDLPELSASQRRRFAPAPDYSARAQALHQCLQAEASESKSARDVAFIVAPPFSGIREALVRFPVACSGDGEGWSVIAPPEQRLLGDEEASAWWDTQDLQRPWVIPELAHFWRRHLSGLALIRELLRRIACGQAGRGIVGCSSWCWQFWASYCSDISMAPRAPAPLNAENLGIWLEHLTRTSNPEPVTARMTNDGLYVLPLAGEVEGKTIKHNGFLRDLAATSRGIPGVALAIWQRALRARPEDDTELDETDGDEHTGASRSRCWLVPLSQLSLPAMPQSADRGHGLVLHALLLHDGLTVPDLSLVTGMSGHELAHALARLQRAQIVTDGDSGGDWHVTALGYPAVRRYLQSWGYPVDHF